MFKSLMVAARDRERLGEVTGVLARYGLDTAIDRLGLGAKDFPAGEAAALPARTRLALEELGPTFVKLGQILATRSDLLPPDWITELERLHSQAATLPFETVRPAIEEALGESVSKAFAAFDPEPLAAASMAQVHRARLHDGRAIVLKIRRPGIRTRMEADLRLIAQFAAVLERASTEIRRFAPTALVQQLASAILEELDFTNEARNADRLRGDLAGNAQVVIPEIHWEWTSETLLAMDYIEGVAPRSAEALVEADIDPHAIASLGAQVVLDMVLLTGRFHADPHPGNLLCLPGNRLALLDLGLIGHVSPRRREELLRFVQAINIGDPQALAETLALWSAGESPPRERLLLAAEQLVARHGGTRLVLATLVNDFFALMRQERLTVPPDLLLIFKALVTIDGVLANIAPGFDLTLALQQAAVRIVASRLDPAAWTPVLQGLLLEITRIGQDGPRLLRLIIERLERDQVIPPRRWGTEIAAAGRWIAGAIVAGSLILAAAVTLF